MRDSISGVFLFQITILFLLVFTAIMSLTINHSKAFAVKSNVLIAIENEGYIDLNAYSLPTELTDAMTKDSYRSVGECSDGFTGFDRNGNRNQNNPSICIKRIHINDMTDKLPSGSYLPSDGDKGSYYQIEVFYKIEFPVLRDVFNFSLLGETKTLYQS